MSGYSFDANILIDALLGHEPAHEELRRVTAIAARPWISRMVWTEVMSKGEERIVPDMEYFLSGFAIDEIDEDIATRAAALRRDQRRLKSPDAIILATAMLRGRVLITRNTRDFPAGMPGIHIPYMV